MADDSAIEALRAHAAAPGSYGIRIEEQFWTQINGGMAPARIAQTHPFSYKAERLSLATSSNRERVALSELSGAAAAQYGVGTLSARDRPAIPQFSGTANDSCGQLVQGR